MEKHLNTVISYFAYFHYIPTWDEIYTFFPVKITHAQLQSYMKHVAASLPPTRPQNSLKYTLPQYSTYKQIKHKVRSLKFEIKNNRTVQAYFYFLKLLPLVRFVGITGASAMTGIKPTDDIDLCIVTEHGQMWTTRFVVVLGAKLLRLHGGRGLCLNLFFDEVDLVIPRHKQNSYIAHELLQMKQVIDKDRVYKKFLKTNGWIARYFPNAPVTPLRRHVKGRARFVLHEKILKSIQLPLIRRNKTGMHLSPTQLWLFKRDFEKKLKRVGLVI